MIITGETIDEFREDFNRGMAELEEKYDITVALGTITYSENRFSARLEVKNSRDKEAIARADFDANVWKFVHLGFSKGMYKRVFIGADGKRYAIVGFNTRAKKYPLQTVRVCDGECFRTDELFVKEIVNEYYVENTADDTVREAVEEAKDSDE